jgi:endonuclease YncB( thermonuclease family)
MRNMLIIGLAVLAAIGASVLWRAHERTVRATVPASAESPLASAETAAPLTAPEPSVPASAAPEPASPAAEASAAPTEATAPAAPGLDPLPQRRVAELPIHTVPEDAVPPASQPLDLRAPATAPAPGKPVALAPEQMPKAAPSSRGFDLNLPGDRPPQAATAEPKPAAPPARVASLPPVKQLAGKGEVAGATALRVAGRPVHLFGVRAPEGGDRCAAEGGKSPLPCAERASHVLSERLARGTASCRFPLPTSGEAAAICLDGDGVDLGGMLVAEGLALADRAQSFDYVGAESIAKAQKRGLWASR